jgi:hypothetical protein
LAITEYLIDGKGTQLMQHDNVAIGVAKFGFGQIPPAVVQRMIEQQNQHNGKL